MNLSKKIQLAISALVITAHAMSQDNITIDLAKKQWHITQNIEKSQLTLEKAPKELTVIFPNDQFQNYQLEFNPVNNQEKIRMSINTSAEPKSIDLLLSDFDNQRIVLKINDGILIGVGNRVFSSSKKITDTNGKLTINFIGNQKATTDAENADQRHVSKHYSSLCDHINDSIQENIPWRNIRERYNFLCNHYKTDKKDCNCSQYPAEYDFKYLLPTCTDTDGNALTPSYHIIYFDKSYERDTHLAGTYTIMKLKKEKGKYEFYRKKKRFSPLAYRELALTIIGKKDTDYIATLNSTKLFMDYEGDFAKSVESSIAQKDNTTTTAQTDSNQAMVASTPKGSNGSEEEAVQMAHKLSDLIDNLGEFNTLLFPTIDFVEPRYQLELNCLISKIAAIFEIKAPKSGEDLAEKLAAEIAKMEKGEKYYKAMCELLDEARIQFNEAINKKTNYTIRTQSFQIPNEDALELSIKTKAGVELFKPKTYLISGGLKIDFSTGIFHSGISAAEFVTESRPFRFKITRDTILPSGRDSVVFTGQVREDSSINIIRKNNKLSFGTGFYVHFYPRTGRNINLGGAAGIIVDNNGRTQLLLGLSIMLNAGKNRVSFVGGLARGREKELSTEVKDSYWSGPDVLNNSKYDLPKNYAGTNPPSYDRWKNSWFVGITFNFASLPGK